MKRTIALFLVLFCLPMTKNQMIRRIRCQNPDFSYEELCRLSDTELKSMLW